LLDIGCYPITLSRWFYGEEPKRVTGTLENDPAFGTDRLASAILEFSNGHAIFTAGTQTNYFQRMTLLGTAGRIDVEIPFNAPTDRALPLTISNGMELIGGSSIVEMIPAADQYTIQGDAFSRAIRENTEVPVPLEDAIANMRVIDAIFKSASSGKWEKP
jgi:predicted dehydrogenase